MGCVSSTLLNQDEDFPQIGTSSFTHHIVSLTSTTYGLLSLDPPPPSPPSPMTPPTPLPRFTLSSDPPTEVINSWELMAGLDTTPDKHDKKIDSFRFSPHLPLSNSKPSTPKFFNSKLKENSNPNTRVRKPLLFPETTKLSNNSSSTTNYKGDLLDQFEYVCPPNGENRIVIYTTTLRGVRKTFEGCNAVRSVFQGLGFAICERDISMDRGLRDELKKVLSLLKKDEILLPCVFIKGRFVGGVDEVLKIHEEGGLVELLRGLPRVEAGTVCDGCGDVRFLPCFKCNGSCKLVVVVKEVDDEIDNDMSYSKNDYCNSSTRKRTVVIRCPDCNENGLVLCPICS